MTLGNKIINLFHLSLTFRADRLEWFSLASFAAQSNICGSQYKCSSFPVLPSQVCQWPYPQTLDQAVQTCQGTRYRAYFCRYISSEEKSYITITLDVKVMILIVTDASDRQVREQQVARLLDPSPVLFEAYQMQLLFSPTLLGRLMALPTNIRLGCQDL